MKTKLKVKRPKRHPNARVPRSRRIGQTTPSGGNVFADLGFPPREAKNLALRSDLMGALERIISDKTQVDAAAFLGVSQPRVSELKRGQIDRFTIDALVNMLAHAGCDTRLSIRRP
jgi:predicted XRE-type DNA-binding protein